MGFQKIRLAGGKAVAGWIIARQGAKLNLRADKLAVRIAPLIELVGQDQPRQVVGRRRADCSEE